MTLRRRLTLWYGGVLVVCVLMAALPAYRDAIKDEADHESSPTEAWREFRDLMAEMAMFCVPPMVVGLIIGAWMTRRALRPLDNFISTAAGINEQTLGERLPAEKRDVEIARLAEVFNLMLARLESSFARIREFTLHASHELKTPLALLRCGIENNLRDWSNLTPDQRPHLAAQLVEIERLARVVDDLGTLTKADAGLLLLQMQPLDIGELVTEMAENAELLARERLIHVTLQSCVHLQINGDRHRLRQLLLNLADNAIKHNRDAGSVTISLERDGDSARLVVCNTSSPLPAELCARVFDRFFRGPEATGNVEGCGLGLSIAHWIVSAHGGTIGFASAPDGQTTVTVSLTLLTK